MAEDTGGKFAYFLAGLGIGSVVGILFAPRSGDETRDLLASRYDESKDYVAQRGREARERAEEYVDRGKRAVNRTRDNINSAVDAGKQAYRDAAVREEEV